MRREFGQDYIREEFDRIGQALDQPLKMYLIGGGAMSFRDLKDATKDIDVVVIGGDDLLLLQDGLKRLGYDEVRDPGEEYEDLGATLMMDNSDGCRFDVFNRQVADKFIFSNGIKHRAEPLETRGNLEVEMASREDVFLFKSVAGRPDDIEDMNVLVQSGLDFEAIEDELETQIELLGEEFFVTDISESLIELEERFGVTTPFDDPVERISKQVSDQLEVLLSLEDTMTVEELFEDIGALSRDRFREMLEQLEEKGTITRNDVRIEKLDSRP